MTKEPMGEGMRLVLWSNGKIQHPTLSFHTQEENTTVLYSLDEIKWMPHQHSHDPSDTTGKETLEGRSSGCEKVSE